MADSVVAFRSQTGIAFEGALGEVLADGPSTQLCEIQLTGDAAELAAVAKLGKRPSDVGRLDLERYRWTPPAPRRRRKPTGRAATRR